jgi:DNA helicase-2/ATP-dependent DNA helicase PcrA
VEALRRASVIDGLSTRAAGAVTRFVATLDRWLARRADGADASAFADLVEQVVRESGLEPLYRRSRAEEDLDRLENLEELINAAAQFAPPAAGAGEAGDSGGAATSPATAWTLGSWLDAYLESVALVSDADMIDPANGAVTLMTLHAAKGLEFDAVAVVGLEAGLLPHHRAAQSDDELEEERRLCFVGITRAKRFLTLTRAHLRTHRGLRERTIPSQFIDELPPENLVTSGPGELDAWDGSGEPAWEDRSARGRRGRSLIASFPAGTLVRHPTFGLGRVESIVPRAAGASARVAFESVGTKTLILEYARLERV